MPGCDFCAYEDSRREYSKQKKIEKELTVCKNVVVVEVPGYKSTCKRELERRMKAELAIAKENGLILIGHYAMPVKWAVLRPVFSFKKLGRRDVKVLDMARRHLARRTTVKFEITNPEYLDLVTGKEN